MIRALVGLIVIALGCAAAAQEVAVEGKGAVLRGLDKVNGQVSDLDLATGDVTGFGSLTVELGECRYPKENPEGDAYARLVIREGAGGRVIFSGWMLASSPALNALEHPRYDVWVLRCRM